MILQSYKLLQGGKYRIERVLGQGGFGITYQAIQVALNRRVAIKEFFMKEYCGRDANTSRVTVGATGGAGIVSRFKEKFLKEAAIISQFDNPHIVRIYDIFEENGTAYYVMEFLDDLGKQWSNKGMPQELALNVVHQVGEALIYIHSKNVLHLDVKPSNILFRKDCAVLIDFGISKRYDAGGGQTSTTPVGISKGFAPLEQYNQGVQKFLPATDVYSLGATLYKFLTGQTPPEASDVMNYGLPTGVLQERHVPENIIQAIKRSMDPRLVQRYQNVKSFMDALGKTPERISWNGDSPKQDVEEITIVQPRHNTGNIGNTEYRNRVTNSEKLNHGSFKYLGLFFFIILFVAILFWLGRADNNQKQPSSKINETSCSCGSDAPCHGECVECTCDDERVGSSTIETGQKPPLEMMLKSCSYERTQICDDNYNLCYYITFPSFCVHYFPDESNDFKNVFKYSNDFKIETWTLWNHIEVDFDSNDVYNELRSYTDLYHHVEDKMVVLSGRYENGMTYYCKAVFNENDDVIYSKVTYLSNLSKDIEQQMIKQLFLQFPK